jgi:hypothetical protein
LKGIINKVIRFLRSVRNRKYETLEERVSEVEDALVDLENVIESADWNLQLQINDLKESMCRIRRGDTW